MADEEGSNTQVDEVKVEPPPDGGLQAWLQVLGGHFLFFNSWGLINTFGVFQTFYEQSLLKSHDTSAISWIGTVQAFILVSLGIVVGPLFDRGYSRFIIIFGTFLTVFGLMMTSLATQYWQVFLAQALCVGLGTGCIFLPSVAIVATYFTTKRAFATGIVASGGSVGSVIYPIVFERLQPRIGFPWATRVMAFIALGTLIVSIALMKTRLPPAKKSRAMIQLGAFKNLPYSFYSIGLFLAFIGLYVPIFYIISWAEVHANVDSDLAFYFLPVLNAASAVGRIIPGLLADRFGVLELEIICIVISALLAYVAIAIHTVGGVAVFAILYGFVSGAVVSLPSAVVAVLTPDMALVGTWMGMAFCFAGAGILIGNPIAGTIINVNEDRFSGGFIFCGSLVIASTAMFILSLVIKNREQRKSVS